MWLHAFMPVLSFNPKQDLIRVDIRTKKTRTYTGLFLLMLSPKITLQLLGASLRFIRF